MVNGEQDQTAIPLGPPSQDSISQAKEDGDNDSTRSEDEMDVSFGSAHRTAASLPPETPHRPESPIPPRSPRPRSAEPSRTLQADSDGDVEMKPPPSPRPSATRLASPVPPLVRSSDPFSDFDDNDEFEMPRPPAPPNRSPLTPRQRRASMSSAPLPPSNIGGEDFTEARERLEAAVRLDINRKYSQALTAYNEAHTLYAPGLNSVTMSPSSRRALERTLDPHHERAAVLEDAMVIDDTDTDHFMVDASRVPPLSRGALCNQEFAVPGPPASMVRPRGMSESPEEPEERPAESPLAKPDYGVDKYLQDLAKIYGDDSRSRPRALSPSPSRPSQREGTPVPSREQRGSALSPSPRREREGTPMPSPDRRTSSPPRGRTQQRKDSGASASGSDTNMERSRERAGTPLPGGAENFENRHAKRGLTSYGCVDESEGRTPPRKQPKIMNELPSIRDQSPRRALDEASAKKQHDEANTSAWMEELYWNHKGQLHGELAKDKYAELRAIRKRLPKWRPYLIDQEEQQDQPRGTSMERSTLMVRSIPMARSTAMTRETKRRRDLKLCGNCGSTRAPDGGPLLLCAKCRETHYCSDPCQKKHRSIHLPRCTLEAPKQQQAMLSRQTTPKPATSPLRQEITVFSCQTPETDIHKMAADANRGRLADLPGMDTLRAALDAEVIDIDEFMREMNRMAKEHKRSNETSDLIFDSSSSSSSDSGSDFETSPKAPAVPPGLESVPRSMNLSALEREFNYDSMSRRSKSPEAAHLQAAEILSSLSRAPTTNTGDGEFALHQSWDQEIPMRGSKSKGKAVDEDPSPLFLDSDSDEDAPHELEEDSSDEEDKVAKWNRGYEDLDPDSKRMLDEICREADLDKRSNKIHDMPSKKISDFRIQADGGRVLEYRVSDATRHEEWCRATALDGHAWTRAMEAF